MSLTTPPFALIRFCSARYHTDRVCDTAESRAVLNSARMRLTNWERQRASVVIGGSDATDPVNRRVSALVVLFPRMGMRPV